jgi:hypothetical protein
LRHLPSLRPPPYPPLPLPPPPNPQVLAAIVATFIGPTIAYPPALALMFVCAYVLRLYVATAYLPFSNTEFGLDTLQESTEDPAEKERLDIMDAMQRMNACVPPFTPRNSTRAPPPTHTHP